MTVFEDDGRALTRAINVQAITTNINQSSGSRIEFPIELLRSLLIDNADCSKQKHRREFRPENVAKCFIGLASYCIESGVLGDEESQNQQRRGRKRDYE